MSSIDDFAYNQIWFDTEFTGLHQQTTLMSLGFVDRFGDTFYAEFTDYDRNQLNDWLFSNVVANFTLDKQPVDTIVFDDDALSLCRATTIRGCRTAIKVALLDWLRSSETRHAGLPVQLWSDCMAYDWVLLVNLLADYSEGYPKMPDFIHYIPMDICPLFWKAGIDPDINREEFSERRPVSDSGYPIAKHNALWDARVIQACFWKLEDKLNC